MLNGRPETPERAELGRLLGMPPACACNGEAVLEPRDERFGCPIVEEAMLPLALATGTGRKVGVVGRDLMAGTELDLLGDVAVFCTVDPGV